MLKADWNRGRSYLDNFVPFVAECLRVSDEPMPTAEVQRALRKRFGMRVPQHTLNTIIGRVVKQGLGERHDGLLHPVQAKLAEKTLTPKTAELLRCYELLVQELIAFAGSRYERVLTSQAATDALDHYVDELGALTVLRGSTTQVEFEPRVVKEPTDAFIVHAFVQRLSESDPATFSYFETIVHGSMLASVVYLPDAGAVQRKFAHNTTVYLDTPFLLRLLGYLGDELAAPASELVELLLRYGARLACFDATLSELRGVLSSALGGFDRPVSSRRDDVTQHLRRKGIRRADLQLRIAELPGELTRRRIHVTAAPGYQAKPEVDEAALQRVLEQRVAYVHESTLLHDLNALVAVHRLRGGRAMPILEEATAIFLTTNAALVRAGREFFRLDDDAFSWPPAILDTDLATLVWLKEPFSAPDLPRKQIVADCYAALHPDQAMWSRYLDEIEHTAASGTYSESQLDVMKFSPEAQRALMDRTLGDVDAIDERTVAQVLADAEATITAPARAEAESERARRETAESEIARERAAREAAEVVRVELEREREQRHARLRATAERNAHRCGLLVFVFLLAVVATGLAIPLLGVGPIPGPHVPGWLRIAVPVLVTVASLVAIASAGWGFSLRSWTRNFERWFADVVHKRALRKLGEA